jgi:hypothetical protein
LLPYCNGQPLCYYLTNGAKTAKIPLNANDSQ